MNRDRKGITGLLPRLLWAIALVAVWFAACSSGEEPYADAEGAADASVTGPTPTRGTTAAPRVGLPTSLGAMMARTHFAFRQVDDGFRAGSALHAARVRDGRVEYRAFDRPPGKLRRRDRDAPRHDTPRTSALIEVQTRGLSRAGATFPAGATDARVEDDGRFAMRWGSVVEHLENGARGLEQSWTFAARPTGQGDLEIAVSLEGATFAGETDEGLRFVDAETGIAFGYSHAEWVPDVGSRTRVRARWDGDRIILRVPAATLADSAYPAVLDPIIYSELQATTAQITEGHNYADDVQVATDGSDFVVIWTDYRAFGTNTAALFLNRVTSAGAVDFPVGLLVSSLSRDVYYPAGIAFDGNDDFHIVWAEQDFFNNVDYGMWRRFRASTGTLQLTSALLSVPAASILNTKAAWDSAQGNLLLAWVTQGAPSTLRYGRVSSGGGIIDGSPTTVAAQFSDPALEVASDGNGTYLATWVDDRDGPPQIYAQRIDASNSALLGAEFPVATSANAQYEPTLTFGTNFALAWSESAAVDVIRGARVTPGGTVLDPSGVPLMADGQDSGVGPYRDNPSIAWDGSSYLVSAANGDLYQVEGRLFDATLSPTGSVFTIDPTYSFSEVAGNATSFFAAWPEGDVTGAVEATRISSAGSILDAPVLALSKSGDDQGSASVAFNGTDYLVAYEQDLATTPEVKSLWTRRITTAGAPTGSPAFCVNNPRAIRTASDGSGFLVIYEPQLQTGALHGCTVSGAGASSGDFEIAPSGLDAIRIASIAFDPSIGSYIVVGANVFSDEIHAHRVDSSGALIDGASGVTLATGSFVDRTSVACGNGVCLANWNDAAGLHGRAFTFGGGDGGVITPLGGGPVSYGSSGNFVRTAASGANDFITVWELGGDVFYSRTSAAGAVLDDAGGVALASSGSVETQPSATWDGSVWWLSWAATYPGPPVVPPDIVGTRIDTSGSIVSPGAFIISGDPEPEMWPDLASDGAGGVLAAYAAFEPVENTSRILVRILATGSANGSPCGTGAECESSFCVDGVCCDAACGGNDPNDCQVCSAANGASQDGVCTTAADGAGCGAANQCTLDQACLSGVCEQGCFARAFVTSGTWNGLFAGDAGTPIEVADARCQAAADAQPLGGVWKAWFSDGALTPADSFWHFDVPYERLDGVRLGNDYADLVDGSLIDKLNVDETGTGSIVTTVWTGVGANGSASASTCQGWSTNLSNQNGSNGNTDSTAGAWTSYSTGACNALRPIYCFEQTVQCTNSGTPDCDDGNPCTADSCDSGSGCQHVAVGNGTPCDDGDLCNGIETCQAGTCSAGTAPDCDDLNACTTDSCIPASGCANTPVGDGTACGDGDACTVDTACSGGVCTAGCFARAFVTSGTWDGLFGSDAGTPIEVADARCQAAADTETLGGVWKAWLSDGALTPADTFWHSGVPYERLDGVRLANDYADLVDGSLIDKLNVDETGTGSIVTSVWTGVDADGSASTSNCQGWTYNAGDIGGAGSTNLATGAWTANGAASCAFAFPLYCFEQTVQCTNSGTPDCDDGNPCTADSCDSGSGCQHVAVGNGTSCDDGDLCNGIETCQAGTCSAGTAPDCDDLNVCTTDSCIPASGCDNTPVGDGTACGDGDVCNGDETCQTGVCEAGVPLDCDDAEVCTDDLCDPVTGCSNPPLPDLTPCPDADACNGNETCQAGACTPGTPPTCDDFEPCTDDSCDPGTGCLYTDNANPCDDGNFCTVNDACALGACGPGAPLPCDDGNGCTDDSCDPGTGCLYTDNSNACDDGDVCTENDVCTAGACAPGTPLDCDDGNLCTDDACTPGVGCEWTDNAAPCDDGQFCNGTDTCSGGSCVSAGDPCGGPDGDGDCAESCDETNDVCTAPDPDTSPCDDGNACTTGEVCTTGVCGGGTGNDVDADGHDDVTCGGDDCDDNDFTVYPGALELCDGIVNDCGGSLPAIETDDDGDNYVECPIDGGGWDGDPSVVGGGDCNDAQPASFPGNPEICDTLDNDCNLVIDDGGVCLGAPGDACTVAGDCASNFCVDAVCCDAACGGTDTTDCQACSVAAGSTSDGACEPLANGTACRASAGLCDVAETCNGASPTCPADGVATVGTECRPSAGACDIAETCDGALPSCPADVFDSVTECRPSAGACDIAETCDGAQAGCPADVLDDFTECRASAGACDIPEICDGAQPDCPVDVLDDFSECRPSTGACDAAEICDGGLPTCPPDVAAPDGTPCDDTDACTVIDECTGGTCIGNGLPDADFDTYFDAACPGGDDCNDTDGAINPGATEICDTIDNNCDANTDEGNVCGGNPGDACTVAGDCASNFCVDGVCCLDGCFGGDPNDCSACNVAGSLGTCTAVPDASPCDDGAFCNGTETCTAGACGSSTGDPCPGPNGDANCAQSCDETVDSCTMADPDSSPCDDGLYCNGTDTCTAGACIVHVGDPCPGPNGDANCAESCDETADNCAASDPDASACDDGLACTQVDECSAGVCAGVGPDLDVDGFGDAACSGTDCDDTDGTVYPGAAELCDGILNDCGGSLPVTETDDDSDSYVECTIDGGGWDGDPSVVGGGDCNDAQPASFPTNPEICDTIDNDCNLVIDDGGVCGGNPGDGCSAPGDCASNFCVDGVCCLDGCFGGDPNDCSACNVAGSLGTCTTVADATACSDGTFCNGTETCTAGACGSSTGDPCPGPNGDANCAESCDETAANCTAADPDASACDDGAFCNGADTCSAGTCGVHVGDPCPGPNGDGNCAESCDEGADTCSAADPDTSPCDDGLACSVGDVCTAGACAGAGPDVDLDTYVDASCGGNDCDDADGTVYPGAAELCDGIVNDCGGSLPVTETDDDADGYVECTIDGGGWDGDPSVLGGGDCNDAQPASFPTNPEICDTIDNDCVNGVDDGGVCLGAPGDACTVPGDCASSFCVDGVCCLDGCFGGDPNDCNACNVSGSLGTCTAVPDATACSDGAFCNGTETCTAGACGSSTGDPCPGPNGDANCQESCDETADACTMTDPDSSPCDDGLYCNGADTCTAGACILHVGDPCPGPNGDANCAESCDETADACTLNDPDASACDDGVACTQIDECSAGVCAGSAPDLDGDGFGDAACGGTDCDDADGTVYPGAAELCDGILNDCGGTLPVTESDDDADGYVECAIDGGGWDGDPSVLGGGDCNDAQPASFPGNPEVCDTFDNDCNLIIDDGGVCGGNPGDGCSAPGDCASNFCVDNVCCEDGCFGGDPNDCYSCAASGNGTCVPVADASPCDDGAFCNGTETCTAGACGSSTGDPCPGPNGDANCAQSCDETVDSCTMADPDSSPCDDGLYCNGTDTCTAGACIVHVGDPCPGPNGDANCAQSCDETADDCTLNDPDASACDDGLACTQVDECSAGVCAGVGPDLDVDGFGDAACGGTDCDDSDFTVYPGALERCDGIVNDCGGSLPVTESDDDADGYVECPIDGGGWDGDPSVLGGGDCNDAQPASFPGNPEVCDTIDNDCNLVIDDGGVCGGNVGDACSLPGDCNSGFCVDQICCADACGGGDPNDCVACNVQAALGTCTAVPDATTCNDGTACTSNDECAGGTCTGTATSCDDANPCTSDACDQVSGCTHTALANGTAACPNDGNPCTLDVCQAGQCATPAPTTTQCATASCSGGTSLSAAFCNGAGTCAPQTQTQCPTGRCDVAGLACDAGCTTDANCPVASFCDATGACVPDRSNGGTCARATQCTSGFCTDGVCCGSACSGVCQACSQALTGAASGTCRPVSAGTDPGSECSDQGAPSCGTTGSCNGAGACAVYASGTACGPDYCQGDDVRDQACDGAGTCVATTAETCTPFACKSGQCQAACTTNADCSVTAACIGGACQPKKTTGATCGSAQECASGSCVDGVCCNSACTGLCRACSAAKKGSGQDGVCGTIGTGRDPDAECSAESASSCGRTGMCNGAGGCALHAAGTECAGATCASTSAERNAKTCDGAGSCLDRGTTLCDEYLCSGSACDTTCQSDADCAPGATCGGNGQCVIDPRLGGPCTTGADCDLGFCADGVCCNESCDGTCEACSATVKGGGSNGLCGPITSGADPSAECSASSPDSCGQDGACDGAGACRVYDAGTVCGRALCSGPATEAIPDICDGAGACVESGIRACNDGFACVGFGCRTTCASDIDCTGSFHCTSGECVPDLPGGAACTVAGHCQSNFCADGVCCDRACRGGCEACSARKKGVGVDGVCEAVAAGTDPDEECPAGASACEAPGFCDGAGACRAFASASTPCGTTTCDTASVTGSLCDGAGACAQNTTACDPFLCDGDGCGTRCAADADCAGAAFCTSAGTCVPKRADGESCDLESQCASGLCADGFCCDAACDGQCEACNVPGAAGVCTAVVGDPRGLREPCSGEGTLCVGRCDGVERAVCTYPTSDITCGQPTCADGTLDLFACDGSGACVPNETVDCSPYQCGDAACSTTCSGDEGCAAGFACTDDGRCETPEGESVCTDVVTLQHPDGTIEICAPFVCIDGACKTGCVEDADCAGARRCESGECVIDSFDGTLPPLVDSLDVGSCGCRTAGGSRGGPMGTLLAAAALGLLTTRRRRRHGAARQ